MWILISSLFLWADATKTEKVKDYEDCFFKIKYRTLKIIPYSVKENQDCNCNNSADTQSGKLIIAPIMPTQCSLLWLYLFYEFCGYVGAWYLFNINLILF